MTSTTEWVAGLRELADYIEEGRMDDEYLPNVRLDFFSYDKDHFDSFASRIGGRREKVLQGSYAIVRRNFGPHTIEVNIKRDAVCQRIEVGERVVPAQEERVEKLFEWECPEGYTVLA